MTRSGKHKQKRKEQPPSEKSSTKAARRERIAARKGKAEPPSGESWFAGKRRLFQFVIVFGVLLGAFNAVFYLWFSKAELFDTYLGLNAECSAMVLRVLGDDARASGTSLISPRYSLEIKRGCDALQASAFFAIGVLASPVSISLLRRMPALVIGTLMLLALNLVRIITLYYTGIYYPNAFQAMHVDVWQPLFIFLPLFLWIMWVRRVERSNTVSPDVSS